MMIAGTLPAIGLQASGAWAWGMLALIALGFAVGWPALANLPAPQTASLVLAATAGIAIYLTARWGTAGAAATATLVALGIGFSLAIMRELIRPAPRQNLIRSVCGTATGLALVSMCGLFLGVVPESLELAWAGAIGVAAGGLAALAGQLLAGRPWQWLLMIGLAVALGVGITWAMQPWLPRTGYITLVLGGVCAFSPPALSAWLDRAGGAWVSQASARDLAVIVLPTVLAAGPIWMASLAW